MQSEAPEINTTSKANLLFEWKSFSLNECVA